MPDGVAPSGIFALTLRSSSDSDHIPATYWQSRYVKRRVQSSPEFTYARAEKALVDIVRHSQHPLDEKQLAALNTEIDNIVTLPELNNLSIIYQIKAVSALVKGKTDESYQAINTGIDLEMSWLNYVLLGKVYEMKGMNREAADAYLTAFNLRPGANTLYWIENGIFQTSVPYVVPYLDKFLASE
mgnify:CR=1 FL=1